MPKDTCPSCGGEKDIRAKQCRGCKDKESPLSRLGTGKGWHLHRKTGYVIGNFGAGMMYQHREVIEFYIGRPLAADEVVHHKDGVKTNNRIENLEILKTCEHHRLHMTTAKAKRMSKKGHEARWGYVA